MEKLKSLVGIVDDTGLSKEEYLDKVIAMNATLKPLFSQLTGEEYHEVLSAFKVLKFHEGKFLIHPGE